MKLQMWVVVLGCVLLAGCDNPPPEGGTNFSRATWTICTSRRHNLDGLCSIQTRGAKYLSVRQVAEWIPNAASRSGVKGDRHHVSWFERPNGPAPVGNARGGAELEQPARALVINGRDADFHMRIRPHEFRDRRLHRGFLADVIERCRSMMCKRRSREKKKAHDSGKDRQYAATHRDLVWSGLTRAKSLGGIV